MKYAVVIETQDGDTLRYPCYSDTERVLAMRIASDASERARTCTVEEDGEAIVRYVRQRVTWTSAASFGLWNDQAALANDALYRMRQAGRDLPRESWDWQVQDPRYDRRYDDDW